MKQNDVVYILEHDSIGVVTDTVTVQNMYEVQIADCFYIFMDFSKFHLIKIGKLY